MSNQQNKRSIIENLKKLALEEGISTAVKEAKKHDDPYILDELHDALADELKQRLLQQGEVEKL